MRHAPAPMDAPGGRTRPERNHSLRARRPVLRRRRCRCGLQQLLVQCRRMDSKTSMPSISALTRDLADLIDPEGVAVDNARRARKRRTRASRAECTHRNRQQDQCPQRAPCSRRLHSPRARVPSPPVPAQYPLRPRGRRGATRWPRRSDADLRLTLQACNRHPVVSAELERLQGVIVHVDEPQPKVAHSLAGIQGMFDLQVESVPFAREHLAHPVRYERKVRGVEQRWHALPAPSDQCRHHALLAEAQRLRTPDSRRAERRWCGRSARCGCGRGSAHPGRCGGCRR